MKVVSLLVAVALVGCGSANFGGKGGDNKDDGEDTPPAPTAPASHHSMLVQSAAALPACDASAEGWLVYLSAEAKFQACQSGAWVDAVIKGEKGEKGDKGDPAAAGSGLEITDHYFCAGSEDLDPDGDTIIEGTVAKIDVFSSGWMYISCLDRYSNSTFLDSNSTSDTYFWPPNADKVGCVAYYVGASFTPADGKLTWKAHGSGQTEVVTCEKS